MFQKCDTEDCFNLRPGLGDGPSDAPFFQQTGYDDFGRPIAVDFQGNVFENIGGNDVSGGAVWAPVELVRFNEPAPTQINRPDDTPIFIPQFAPLPAMVQSPTPAPVSYSIRPEIEATRTAPALSPVLSPVAPSRAAPPPAPVPAPVFASQPAPAPAASIFAPPAPAPAPSAGGGSTGGGMGTIFAPTPRADAVAPANAGNADGGGGDFFGQPVGVETEQMPQQKSGVPLALLVSLALAFLPG
jgi:hypothetical protein